MLKAIEKKTDKIVLSYLDTIDKNKKYICPTCKKKLIFINATLKIKHFRHKKKSKCNFEPETERHIQMKKFFIDKLNLSKDNIEVYLGFAKPDIFLQNSNIAIEVQHSTLTYSEFIYRTTRYSNNNIYTLWIFDNNLLKTNISSVLKKAHELYFGRVYIFFKDSIFPVHFNSIGRWIDNDYFGYKYWKWYKKRKEFNFGKKIKNFSFLTTKNTWKNNNFKIAKFTDKNWWK